MDIGPIFGIADGLADPRRTEGIRAPHFQVGASTPAAQDRTQHQHAGDHSTAHDNAGADSGELDQELNEASASEDDPLRGTQVNFIA